LQKSHLLPAAVFKLLRSPNGEIPDPIHTAEGVSRTTSSQPQSFFLCRECEQRFSDFGESEILRLCARRNGSFLLRDSVLRSRHIDDFTEGSYSVFDCQATEGFPQAALTYFAASIIWRSSAGIWRFGSRLLRPTDLGPFEEPFRKYLHGRGDCPGEVAVLVTLAKDRGDLGTAFLPQTFRKGNKLKAHVFRIPGILFEVFVSRNLPRRKRWFLFLHFWDQI
jgi:hypothetical protein